MYFIYFVHVIQYTDPMDQKFGLSVHFTCYLSTIWQFWLQTLLLKGLTRQFRYQRMEGHLFSLLKFMKTAYLHRIWNISKKVRVVTYWLLLIKGINLAGWITPKYEALFWKKECHTYVVLTGYISRRWDRSQWSTWSFWCIW